MILSIKKATSSDELYNMLQLDICEGRIGERLPSITQLCSLYKVSHCTVKKVLDRLKSNKYIEGFRGKCVQVNKIAIGNPLFRKSIVFYLHINTMGNPYYLKVLVCIRQLLQASGSSVHFVNSPEQLAELDFKPDIMVLSEVMDENEIEELESICGRGKVVKLNDSSQNYNTVGTDNYSGGCQAAKYLYAMGHRRVGLISRNLDISGSFFANRFNGFNAFANKHTAMKVYNSEVNMDDNLNAAVPAATEKLFCDGSGITAIFAFTDMLALGVCSYCADKGLSIPNDISVLGFDNRDFGALLLPALTTFQEDSEQVARLAKEMIFKIITKQDGTNTILVKPFLIERNSVKNINNNRF